MAGSNPTEGSEWYGTTRCNRGSNDLSAQREREAREPFPDEACAAWPDELNGFS